MAGSAAGRITFFSKKDIECPICGTSFLREDLLTGRGRLIAGNLKGDLRREYEASTKFGDIHPLIYPVTVCPGCYYSALPQDFLNVSDKMKDGIDQDTDSRISGIQQIFPELDFREPRTLKEGIASYFFAMMSYDHFPKQVSPTIKQAISGIRAAWLCDDLHKSLPMENFDYLAKTFNRKACFLYNYAVDKEQNGEETVANAANLGPDLDKNYGFDGVLYLSSYLEYHFGPRADEEKRKKALAKSKTTVARLFGMGKASKQKPSAILDKARDLYDIISEILQEEDEEEDEQP